MSFKTVVVMGGGPIGLMAALEAKQFFKKVMVVEKRTKVRIKKADQMYSPWYPAVLVGDAAVTPHPETGSGMVTGLRGVEELNVLFQALSKTHRSHDNESLFLNFHKSFELHVAEKALSGAYTTLENLKKMLGQFKVNCTQLRVRQTDQKSWTDPAGVLADMLIKELDDEMNEAGFLSALVKAKDWRNIVSNYTPSPTGNESVSHLWAKVAVTHKEIEKLTGNVTFIEDQIAQIKPAQLPKDYKPRSALV